MSTVLAPLRAWRMGGLAVAGAMVVGCAPAVRTSHIPPAPILLLWPDPTFVRERQCRPGRYDLDKLEGYRARAQLAMSLPSTESVELDQERQCITLISNSLGGARAAELILRGVHVPR